MYIEIAAIQEELVDLQKLIHNTNALTKVFPDDKLLQITLKNLLTRQAELHEELIQASSYGTEEVLVVHVPKGPIKGHTVSIPFLASFLKTTQNLITEIGISLKFGLSRPKRIKQEVQEDLQLGLLGVSYGSFGLILSRFGMRNLDAFCTQLNQSLDELYSLLECRADGGLIKQKVHKLGPYVANTYRAMVKNIFESGASATITSRCETRPTKSFELTSPLAKEVFDVVSQVDIGEKTSLEMAGQLKGLSLLRRTFEFVPIDSGPAITGKYDVEVEDKVKSLLDYFIMASFDVSHKVSPVTDKITPTYQLTKVDKLHDPDSS